MARRQEMQLLIPLQYQLTWDLACHFPWLSLPQFSL